MKDDIKKSNVNSASISEKQKQSVSKVYIAENALPGKKAIEPVAIAMQNFIKNEFSKFKAH